MHQKLFFMQRIFAFNIIYRIWTAPLRLQWRSFPFTYCPFPHFQLPDSSLLVLGFHVQWISYHNNQSLIIDLTVLTSGTARVWTPHPFTLCTGSLRHITPPSSTKLTLPCLAFKHRASWLSNTLCIVCDKTYFCGQIQSRQSRFHIRILYGEDLSLEGVLGA